MRKLDLGLHLPIEVFDGGLLISRGLGRHPERVFPYYDLIFVRSGVLSIREEDREFQVKPDECLLLWPGRRHAGTTNYDANLSFYWVHFVMRDGGAAEAAWMLGVPQHTRVHRPDHLTELFRRFLDEQAQGGPPSLVAHLMMTLILAEVTRSEDPPEPPLAGSRLALRARTYIQSNFHHSLTASRVADAIGCNPNYLARIYRAEFGNTLTDDIHEFRLAHARRLLIEGHYNVDEVAMQCGFGESNYFRRLFKRRHGTTPSAFRKLHSRAFVNTE